MSSRGANENNQLKQNLSEQMRRLVDQLNDLEEVRNDIDIEEYEEMRNETLDQLLECKESLAKFSKGDLTLIDSINAAQLAIQSAISNAFQTPEVIRMFTKKQPDQLRDKLSQNERDHKIGKLSLEHYREQKLEVLTALKQLKEPLTSEEEEFMNSISSESMKHFDQVSQDTGSGKKMMELAQKAMQ